MTTYFKAIRPDGGSFNDPSFKWGVNPGDVTTHPAFDRKGDASGYLSVATVATDCTGMKWPCRLLEVKPAGCRVFTPDKVDLPNKRAGRAFRTVAELPAHDVFGPQGVQVAALIERCGKLTRDEVDRLYAARNAARDAAGDAAWYAARDAARNAAWYAAWNAAGDAAGNAAWYAAGNAARNAARDAARNAAWYAAWNAAGDAAGNAAWNAATNAATNAAWNAAWNAARDAAVALVARDLISVGHYNTLTMPWRAAIGRIHPDDQEVMA